MVFFNKLIIPTWVIPRVGLKLNCRSKPPKLQGSSDLDVSFMGLILHSFVRWFTHMQSVKRYYFDQVAFACSLCTSVNDYSAVQCQTLVKRGRQIGPLHIAITWNTTFKHQIYFLMQTFSDPNLVITFCLPPSF